jgi:hypothetical protein
MIKGAFRKVKDIDKMIQNYVKDGDPGIAVSMVEHGQVMYRKGHGLAHLESACPVTPTTIFCLASLTKSFTATVILLLEQQSGASRMGVFGLADWLSHISSHFLQIRCKSTILCLSP